MRENIIIGYCNENAIPERVKCVCMLTATCEIIRTEMKVSQCDVLITPTGEVDGKLASMVEVVTPFGFSSMVYRTPFSTIFTPEEILDGFVESCQRCVSSYTPLVNKLLYALGDIDNKILAQSDSRLISFKNGYNRHDYLISEKLGIVRSVADIREDLIVDVLISNTTVLEPEHGKRYTFDGIEHILSTKCKQVSYSEYKEVVYELFINGALSVFEIENGDKLAIVDALNSLNKVKADLVNLVATEVNVDGLQEVCVELSKTLKYYSDKLGELKRTM